MLRTTTLFFAMFLMGCATTGSPEVPVKGEPTVAAPPGPPKKGGEELPPPPAASKELHGVLSYKAVRTDVMSVDAYLGDQIRLIANDGTHALVATAAVSKDRLKELDGHSVTVTAQWSDGEAPDPNEAAPMDGPEPMKRGVGFQVLAVVDHGAPPPP